MQQKGTAPDKPIWIRGPELRKRWGMSNTTFYVKLKARLIPGPEHPFGPRTPYWRIDVIERFERSVRNEC